jgi:hypothetical protein
MASQSRCASYKEEKAPSRVPAHLTSPSLREVSLNTPKKSEDSFLSFSSPCKGGVSRGLPSKEEWHPVRRKCHAREGVQPLKKTIAVLLLILPVMMTVWVLYRAFWVPDNQIGFEPSLFTEAAGFSVGALMLQGSRADEGRYRVEVADVWSWRGRRPGLNAVWTLASAT